MKLGPPPGVVGPVAGARAPSRWLPPPVPTVLAPVSLLSLRRPRPCATTATVATEAAVQATGAELDRDAAGGHQLAAQQSRRAARPDSRRYSRHVLLAEQHRQRGRVRPEIGNGYRLQIPASLVPPAGFPTRMTFACQ